MNQNLAAAARKKLLRRGRELVRQSSRRGGDISSLGEGEQRELAEIHAALERIERASYGRCDKCYNPISFDMLDQRPWQRMCEGCMSPEEIEELTRDESSDQSRDELALRVEI